MAPVRIGTPAGGARPAPRARSRGARDRRDELHCSGDGTGAPGAAITFTAKTTAADPSGQFEGDFDGDGVFETTSDGNPGTPAESTLDHVFMEAGVYQVSVRVADSAGGEHPASAKRAVTVATPTPTATAQTSATPAAVPFSSQEARALPTGPTLSEDVDGLLSREARQR